MIDYNIIVEIHGEQHYVNSNLFGSLEDTKHNDRIKRKLAKHNGINNEHYIVIDARKSKANHIKKSIINSKLNNLCDLKRVNWKQCDVDAQHYIVKDVCDYYFDNDDTIEEIADYFQLSISTIKNYIKIGTENHWC